MSHTIVGPPATQKRGLFLDFDSTITTPIKIDRFRRHAVADRPEIFKAMLPEEIVANFGGQHRIACLAKSLKLLRDTGVELFIVSIGLRDACILPHMRSVGLASLFHEENVYGQDSLRLRKHGFVKGRLIAELMAERGMAPHEALFVDDSLRHVEDATGVCDVLHVSGQGLSAAELDAVEVMCLRGALQARDLGIHRLVGSAPNGSQGRVDNYRVAEAPAVQQQEARSSPLAGGSQAQPTLQPALGLAPARARAPRFAGSPYVVAGAGVSSCGGLPQPVRGGPVADCVVASRSTLPLATAAVRTPATMPVAGVSLEPSRSDGLAFPSSTPGSQRGLGTQAEAGRAVHATLP